MYNTFMSKMSLNENTLSLGESVPSRPHRLLNKNLEPGMSYLFEAVS